MMLPEDINLLSELLSEAGYSTFATSAGAHIRSERGYDRGFDEFHETYRVNASKGFIRTLLRNRSAGKQLLFSSVSGHDNYTLYKFDQLKQWLTSVDDPFFAFVNCKTAHSPYNPPRPYKQYFCNQLERPRFEFTERLLERLGKHPQSVNGLDADRLHDLSWKFPILADSIDPTDEELDVLTAWYDGAIRYVDDRIGNLVRFMRSHDIFEDTHIIVTADHGELFGEHELQKHWYSVYEPVLHVPLVLHPALNSSSEQGNISTPVSLIDLYPTILDIADAHVPDRPNAARLTPTGTPPSDRYLFAEVGSKSPDPIKRHHPSFDDRGYGKPLQSARDDEYKLIRSADGDTELYRWRDDPAESNDRSAAEPEVVNELKAAIEAALSPMNDSPLEEDITDPALKSHLEELGYL
jgi:arylsulfatase A-like enzyme